MADVDIMMSQWQSRGGTVMQSTASNGRILRTFIAPSGEKFRSWKECLKYMEDNTECQNDEPATRKKRLSSGKDAKGSNGSLKKKAKRNSDEKQNNEIVIVEEDSKGSNGSSKKKAKRNSDETQNNEIVIVEEDADPNSKEDDLANGRKQPKRAAACSNFKEKTYAFSVKDSIIESKAEKVVDGEDVAIVLTSEGGDEETPQRRLVDFIVHDDQGRSQPIETVDIMPLYITGTVVPMKGPLDKQKGVRCEGFGPLQSWSVTGYEESSPTVWICTDTAEYACSKPAGAYKKSFSHIFDKAVVCVEVYRALSKPDGGDPQLSLNDVFARISRSLLGGKSSLSQYFTRDYFYSIGKFVNEQLKALDVNADENEQIFSGLPALDALEDECAKRTSSAINQAHVASRNGTLTIRDNGLVDASGSSLTSNDTNAVTDDEKLARLLQQQEEMSFGNVPARRGRGMPKSKVYIKINEDEIANDYPLPAYYKADEEETDEYVLFDDEAIALDPADLPRRKLTDWALYNSDSRLVSLELLPMLPGAETDMEIFGSGIMTEDDGSGFCLDSNVEDSNEVNGSGSNPQDPQGIRIYLSAIKEWMIEFGASMLFISIRTDGAWYRLGKPSPQYIPWYNPVLKTAKLAIRVITMLKEASRVSRLSFADVIKRLTDQEKDEGTFISSKTPDVERYVVVHGQIILQQFAEYPDETVRRSAFVNGLTQKMEQKHHTKLTIVKKKIVIKKGKNLNPRANLRPDGTKAKPMRATTTKLIHRIWSEYYAKSSPNGEVGDQNGVDNEVKEIEEDADENEENEDITDVPTISKTSRSKTGKTRTTVQSVKWVGKSLGKAASGDSLYSKATFRGEEIVVGGTVSAVLDDDDSALPVILLIEYLYQKNGSYMLHGRTLERGCLTVLGNAADNREVYLMDNCEDISIDCIKETVVVNFRNRPWGHEHRKADGIEDEEHRIKAEEREKKGLPTEYFCRAVYCPDKGAFFSLSSRTMGLGTGICNGCQIREGADAKTKTNIFSSNDGICVEGVDYLINDFLYLDPSTFEPLDDDNDQKEKFKGGRSKGLRAFVICQLMSVKSTSNGKRNDTSQLTVRRFYRPEDIGPLKAYKADAREVYYSEDTATVSSNSVRGRCEVWRHQDALLNLESNALRHVFYCSCIFDPKKGTVKQLPAAIKLGSSRLPSASKGKSKSDEVAKGKGKMIVDEVVAKVKGKGKMIEDDQQQNSSDTNKESRLATLDIFAGCGGLSEGLHQSGVSNTRWAIEYEHPAAEAFKLNHPTSEVFCENCNVILRCIMEKGGDLDDCLSTPEAAELCLKLDDDKKNRLPKPGEVDFINGGPPCQGFSGMNRFNQRAWSKVQCEMILAFLSYADYFRPRYFLLENVRNFISFNKGQTFRLTLASLLAMGYQVRFGILQAGNYGVSQSRTRAFIWAASPMDKLPEWPEPMHVFAGSQLKIPLSNGLYYAAVKDASQGAAFRSITVRDTIADLPPVGNGATEVERSYGNDPESWFQKQIRGQERVLYDHISKEMNELNLIRCQRIPKRPGADWRDLPEEKVKLSTGQVVDLIPWCLPNTADRHNQWKGLFGRLDWDGNFPTSVTDPQPMGKVGMCFHPEQDRIVTVRECARSQGFPDRYKFYGNIQSKHRQIGNAVPPPLARALGEKLKEVIHQEEPCE